MALKMGYAGQLYRNPTLITASVPSTGWVLMDNVKDLTIPDAMREVDVETKAAGGVTEYEPSSYQFAVEFMMEYDPSDADITAVETAFRARSALAFAFMDDTMANAVKGTVCNMKVFKFEKQQPISGSQKVAIALKPCFGSKLQAYTATGTGA